MFLASLAFKNLTRNLGRNTLSMVSAIFGVCFLIFGLSFIDGIDESVLRAAVNTEIGHVRVVPPVLTADDVTGFPVDELEPVPAALTTALGDHNYTQRLRFDARLIAGTESSQVMGMGVDPVRDPLVFPRDKYTVVGDWDGLVLGSLLAEQIGLEVGSPVFVQVRTSAGAINALNYEVAGLVSTNNPAIDSRAVVLPMDAALALVGSPGPSEIAVRLDNPMDADQVAASLNGDWVATTYIEESAAMLEIGQIRRRALGFLIFMIMGISATGIANTVIMAAYERIREIGTLAAMGMSREQIRRMFLIEGFALGVLGSGLGAALGAAITWWFAVEGFDFSELMKESSKGGMAFDTMVYTHFSLPYILGAAAFGTVVATLASLYPAAWAARLNPADAVRAE
jgi:putative ABC transport system permease protein